jgi:hypothetical protein
MSRSFLNKPNGALLEVIAAIIKMCLAHLVEYKIKKREVEKLQSLYKKAISTYTANNDPMTRNKLTTRNKNSAFKEMKLYASKFITMLVLNENIPNEVLTTLGIRSRYPEHHRRSAPVSPFDLKLEKDKTKVLAFGRRLVRGQPLETKVPDDATGGMRLEYYLKSKGIETVRNVEDSKATHVFDLPEETKGDTLVVRGQWIDSRFRGGPWSDWVEIFLG